MSCAKSASMLTLLFVSASGLAQNANYTPIPTGFDFPAQQDQLLNWVQTGNEPELRRHAWMLFAGLTQPARPGEASSEAVWETWYSGSEVFTAGAGPQGLRTLQRKFIVPRQFKSQARGAAPQAIGESELAFTLFNKETRDHTRSNRLNLASAMQAINDGWTAQTPVADRKVKDYPREAMSLKIVWRLVKKTGFTAIPVWDERPRVATAPALPVASWPRRVAVDPAHTTIAPNTTHDFPGFPGSRVVPLSSFYHFKLTAEQAAQVNQTLQPLPPPAGQTAVAGDYVVMLAMHVTTKEIPNWVWGTFWWHDDPDHGPFAAGRPVNTLLKAPWRNYLMDVAYEMTVPKESDNTPNAVFNPWLEAPLPNGVNSNCMSCHQRAVWLSTDPSEQPFFLPVTRGPTPQSDDLFKSGTKADFLWSVVLEGNQ